MSYTNFWDHYPISHIEVTEHDLPLGGVRYDFEWVGDSMVVGISLISQDALFIDGGHESIKIGHCFRLGPFDLRIVGHDPIRDEIYCVRTNFEGAFAFARLRCRRWFKMLSIRLILTAAVWGLAEFQRTDDPLWREPSWRDLKIAKRWRKPNGKTKNSY